MNPVVNLTAKAVQEINEILSRGKGVEIAVRNGKVVVWETASKKKYEAVIERQPLRAIGKSGNAFAGSSFSFGFKAARL